MIAEQAILPAYPVSIVSPVAKWKHAGNVDHSRLKRVKFTIYELY